LFTDNKPVVSLSGEGNNLKRSKHFIVKTEYIRENKQNGDFSVDHIYGLVNHPDIHTKSLNGILLIRRTEGVLGK
jgi:hypothetical protein